MPNRHVPPGQGHKSLRKPRPERKSAQVLLDRDYEMWRDWVAGKNEYALSKKYGITFMQVQKRLKNMKQLMAENEPTVAEFRQIVVNGTLEIISVMNDNMQRDPIPAYSNGKPILDTDGNQALDYGLQLNSATLLLKAHERLAKITGVEAPSEQNVTITVQAQTEAERAAAEALSRLNNARALPPGSVTVISTVEDETLADEMVEKIGAAMHATDEPDA